MKLCRLSFLLSMVLCGVSLFGGMQPAVVLGQQTATPAGAHTADPWWKHAVIYEIYPRSFQDSNGDGVGDIKGIESRLGYLEDLGVNAIWITPMYPSPGIDYGYDISNYTAIDPEYGTMADFEHLVAEAKKHNIRVIMDYVINHTSDQSAWFKESRSSRTNPKRDWYIWRDGKGPGQPPNNWESWFGHSAWTYDEKTGQWYYHYFYPQQPDLNWRNLAVHKAMEDVLRFWMDKGVAGFRIDAVSRLFEDPALHDDPLLPGYNVYGDRNIQHKYTDNYPEVHDVLKELNKVVSKYPGDPVLITEADEPNVTELTKLYGNGDEVQLPMDFQIADLNKLSAPGFRKLFNDIENNTAHGQPEYFFSNHDQPRQWDRYGDGVHNDQIAKLMAALLLMTRGTPQMYYGEEIGMRTTDPARIEDVHDPIGKLGWPKEKGRDGERTPMQWTPGPEAGFTTSDKPWIKVPPSAKKDNVETEEEDPNSIFNAYKKLLALRKSEPALRDGSYQSVDNENPYVFSFLRRSGTDTVLVSLNMSDQPRTVNLKGAEKTLEAAQATPLFAAPSIADASIPLDKIQLAPFGVLVATVR
jgi:alpha-glucosidase